MSGSTSYWPTLKEGAASAILSAGYPFAGNAYYVGPNAPIFGNRIPTIQEAVNLMVERDILFIGPGEYDEAVVIPIGLDKITIMGAGNVGEIFIAPSAADSIAMLIEGSAANRTSDITLVNVGLEGDGTGGGLHVKGNIRRVRVQSCKCEGGAFAIKLESTIAAGFVADTIIENCELTFTETALHMLASGGGDPVTQTRLLDCLLDNFSSRGVHVDASPVADLWIHGNRFCRQEDDSEPTNEYILADVANSTGNIAGNSFPANAASAKIVLAAGVRRCGNSYTDGWAA